VGELHAPRRGRSGHRTRTSPTHAVNAGRLVGRWCHAGVIVDMRENPHGLRCASDPFPVRRRPLATCEAASGARRSTPGERQSARWRMGHAQRLTPGFRARVADNHRGAQRVEAWAHNA
jgi:hypothetical protein